MGDSAARNETEELRIDPTDGGAFTKAEFMGEYGGTAECDAALPAPEAAAIQELDPECPDGNLAKSNIDYDSYRFPVLGEILPAIGADQVPRRRQP